MFHRGGAVMHVCMGMHSYRYSDELRSSGRAVPVIKAHTSLFKVSLGNVLVACFCRTFPMLFPDAASTVTMMANHIPPV